jgi:DNA-binding NtrC family response regulator
VSRGGRERVIAVAGQGGLVDGICHWDLLQAGASDVLIWSTPDRVARQVRNRLERWLSVDQLIEAPSVADFVVGKSAVWRAMLRGIVEIARFSDAPALILGESGTGKEIIARLSSNEAGFNRSRLFHCRSGTIRQRVLWT